jgi:hypothetical protein
MVGEWASEWIDENRDEVRTRVIRHDSQTSDTSVPTAHRLLRTLRPHSPPSTSPAFTRIHHSPTAHRTPHSNAVTS